MAELNKNLSYPVILIITMTNIIGTGVFFLPAVGIREAGPASIISWLILTAISIYISMLFAELTSMFPTSGGTYEFCKQAYGRFTSFIIGWMTILAGNITIAMLIVGAIQYLLPFTGTATMLGMTISSKLVKLAMCIFFIIMFNYIAFKGIKTSATMMVVFGIITLSTLASLIVTGIWNFDLSTVAVSSAGVSDFLPFGLIPVVVSIFFIAETFFGWETATFLAAETKDGKRVVPKALVTGTKLIGVIVVLLVIISLGNLPWDIFGASDRPLSLLGETFFGSLGEMIFTLLVYVSIIGSVAGWIVSAPRLLLAMADDKLLLGQFKEIHPKNKTPYKAIMFQTVFTLILVSIGFDSYEFLLHLLVPLVLITYSFVILAVYVLRRKKPDHPRYYKAPFVKHGSFSVVAFLAFLIIMWIINTEGAVQTMRFGLSLIGFGIPLYFLIEMYYDPKAIIKVNDSIAHLALFTESITVPKNVRKRIFEILKGVRGKKVLEYGCSVGTITLMLARLVGPHGEVYATDISMKHLKITHRRVRKQEKEIKDKHPHLYILHDEQQMTRIHPSIPYADVVISMGMLGYVQDIKKVLNDIYNILPEGGEICLVEFGDFFGVIPNVEWLSNNARIEKIFRECGFSVRVIREKGIFWNYIYVYGIKSKEDIPVV
ncbi:MAG: amino acid permease [Nanobdellota archaeon]